jgi:phage tail sheath gpL-like
MPPIDLPPEIATTDKTPRTAIAEDTSSGVKSIPPNSREVLLIAQRLAAGSVAAGVPTPLNRETDSEGFFVAGSILDIQAKAAFKAYPLCKLTAVALDDAGGATVSTLTYTIAGGNAAADGSHEVYINGKKYVAGVLKNDTPTQQAAAVAAVVNADPNCPVTAVAVAGVVTFTSKNKGLIVNSIFLRYRLPVAIGSTVALAPTTGYFAGGTGTAVLTSALAAIAGKRFHLIALGLDDSTSALALRDHISTQGNGENDKGEIAVVAFNGSESAAQTLALATNHERMTHPWINSSETWQPAISAGAAAVMSSETQATKPYNGMPIDGVLPPTMDKRPTRTETRNSYDNGVSPLVVLPGEKVAFQRVISSRSVNAAGNKDYTLLDITIIQGLDRVRDLLIAMLDNPKYQRAKWADDDPTLPPDVVTPSRLNDAFFGVLLDAQAEGTLQNVLKYKDEQLVVKVGTQAQYSLPADVIDGLHEKLGKIVLFRQSI